MFALVAFILVKMARIRFGAVYSGEMDPAFYKTFQDGQEPEHIRVVTRHFINQFEVPVLFHVIVILAYVTHHVSWPMVGLAWGYVAIRYVHSYVHLGSNDVLLRARLYFASGLVLAAMWVGLFACLLIEG
jgi:hypothetical protein